MAAISLSMAIAAYGTYSPDEEAFAQAEPFHAAVVEDTMALAGLLADALEIITQCHARNVPLTEEFFAYVDDLTEQIHNKQPSGAVHSA